MGLRYSCVGQNGVTSRIIMLLCILTLIANLLIKDIYSIFLIKGVIIYTV